MPLLVQSPKEQNFDEKARQMEKAGIRIIRGTRKTGDGDWEFESADPDGNRIEVVVKHIQDKKQEGDCRKNTKKR